MSCDCDCGCGHSCSCSCDSLLQDDEAPLVDVVIHGANLLLTLILFVMSSFSDADSITQKLYEVCFHIFYPRIIMLLSGLKSYYLYFLSKDLTASVLDEIIF